MCVCVCKYTHIYKYIYLHIYIHAHTHTYTHTYAYTFEKNRLLPYLVFCTFFLNYYIPINNDCSLIFWALLFKENDKIILSYPLKLGMAMWLIFGWCNLSRLKYGTSRWKPLYIFYFLLSYGGAQNLSHMSENNMG